MSSQHTAQNAMRDVAAVHDFGENNFDLLRLVAAAQVMLVHIGDHAYGREGVFILALRYLPGVPVFFFISGFLISASWERNADLRTFALNRFLRIFPAYWAAFALSLTGIVLFYHGFDPVKNADKLALWAAAQLLMLPDWNPEFLRGYGDGVANGSLWTIPIELSFYASIPVFYWLFRKIANANAVLVAIIVASFAVEALDTMWIGRIVLPIPVFKFVALTPIPWLGQFATGILAQRNAKRILPIVTGRIWLFGAIYGAVALLSAFKPFPPLFYGTSRFMGFVNFPCLCLLIMAIAYSHRELSQNMLRRNDISYGVYLYHLPILNMLLAVGISGWQGLSLTIACTVPVAIASWLLIEKPALKARRWALYWR